MKMGKEIYELLLAYLREDISEKEMIRLQGWLAENERHRKLMEELRDKEVLRREIGTYASFDTSRCWIKLPEDPVCRGAYGEVWQPCWWSLP